MRIPPQMKIVPAVFLPTDLSVGLGGPGGDGAAEEGTHGGPEGDEGAAGKITLPYFCRIIPIMPGSRSSQ